MDATIRRIDKRHCTGENPSGTIPQFLFNTTYEDILAYLKKHKNAISIVLYKSPKHADCNDTRFHGSAFFTREEYSEFMKLNNNIQT